MDAKKIELLVALLVVALLLETAMSYGLVYYSELLRENNDYEALKNSPFIEVVKYGRVISTPIVSIVISFWLFSVSSSSKWLWALFGLLANWWGLLVFGVYIFNGKSEKST